MVGAAFIQTGLYTENRPPALRAIRRGVSRMVTREPGAKAPAPPAVIDPFRRCAQELVGELGHAFDLIRTQADEFSSREAELLTRRADIEAQTTELSRIRAEIDLERQVMSDRRQQLAEYLLDAPTDLPGPTAKPVQQTFKAPKIDISIQEPEVMPIQPEPAAGVEQARDGTGEPGAKESLFRKLRRDARRKMKGL